MVLAVLAGVVLFQLYAVLGRKIGRGPEAPATSPQSPPALETPRLVAPSGDEPAALTGLAALRSRDPNFDSSRFLQGARGAYETIVKAFAQGDQAALVPLLAPSVMEGFETAINSRANKPAELLAKQADAWLRAGSKLTEDEVGACL